MITPARDKKRSLSEVLGGVRDDNVHEEWDSDLPVGKEEW